MTNVPVVELLTVADIVVRDRLRPVTEAGVESLMASIRDIGAIKDEIHVRHARRGGKAELRLLAGGHRLEAARRLGWETIRAKVWRDIADNLAGLIEVDDNLAGAEMGALDTAVFLARRKELYEEAHPEAKRGVAGALARWDATDTHVSCFVDATAEKFGFSSRQVYRLVAAGAKLSASDVARLRQAPRPVTQADLQVIARISSTADRIGVVDALATGTARSAGAALKGLGTVAPAPTPDPTDVQVQALRTAWSRAGAAARRRWIAEAFDELSPMVVDHAGERDEAEIIDLRAHLAGAGGAA